MQEYCEKDVEVTHELYKLIQKQNYSPEAIRLEHDFARCIICKKHMDFILMWLLQRSCMPHLQTEGWS